MYKINLLISCSQNIDYRLLVGVEVKTWVFFFRKKTSVVVRDLSLEFFIMDF